MERNNKYFELRFENNINLIEFDLNRFDVNLIKMNLFVDI